MSNIWIPCALDFVNDTEKVLPILVLEHRLSQFAHLLFVNPSLTVCNALETGDLKALALLNGLNVVGGLS